MAVRLEGTTKRYIGLSTDTKPVPVENMAEGEILPPGSSFLETDTGLLYRWSGEQWTVYVAEDEQAQLLQGILMELSRLRKSFEWVNEYTSEDDDPD